MVSIHNSGCVILQKKRIMKVFPGSSMQFIYFPYLLLLFFPLFCFLSQIDIFTKMSICKMSVFPSTLSLILSFSLSKQRNKMYLILIFEGPLLEFFLKPETKKKFHLFNNYGIVRHFGLFTYLLILPQISTYIYNDGTVSSTLDFNCVNKFHKIGVV